MVILDLGISDKETMYIGKIITYWSAIENEIFLQSVANFENIETLPKELKNLQFTSLKLYWKEFIIDKTENEIIKNVLNKQFEEIEKVKDIRDAIAHSFWEWSSDNLSQIKTIRVRKDKIISLTFTVDDLENFFIKIAEMYTNIKCPNGITDIFSDVIKKGYSEPSRMALSRITNHKISTDWNIIN